MNCDGKATYTLQVTRGESVRVGFGLTDPQLVYKPITAASQTAPCVITVPNHGMPAAWIASIGGAKGMTRLNRMDVLDAVVLSADEIEINEFNASSQPAYSGGGYFIYPMPSDMDGMTYSATFYGPDDAVVLTLSALEKDPETNAVILELTDEQTSAFGFFTGRWRLESTDPDGDVFPIIDVSPLEVTQ